MASWAIPISALIISAFSLLIVVIGMKKKANGDYVEGLERRIEKLENDLKESRAEVFRLRNDNIDLMRRVLGKVS